MSGECDYVIIPDDADFEFEIEGGELTIDKNEYMRLPVESEWRHVPGRGNPGDLSKEIESDET